MRNDDTAGIANTLWKTVSCPSPRTTDVYRSIDCRAFIIDKQRSPTVDGLAIVPAPITIRHLSDIKISTSLEREFSTGQSDIGVNILIGKLRDLPDLCHRGMTFLSADQIGSSDT